MKQFKGSRGMFDLVPESTIDIILDIDAQVLAKSEDHDRFVKENKTEYTVAVNTWMYLIKSYSYYGWSVMLRRIVQYGLSDTVIKCLDVAQYFVSNDAQLPEGVDYNLFVVIYNDIEANPHRSTYYHSTDDSEWSVERIFLTVLRYLKRMSPNYTTQLEEDAVDSFFKEQKRLKGLDRGCQGIDTPWVIDLIRDEVNKLDIQSRIRAFSQLDIHDLELTSGVGYDSKSNLESKLKAIYKACPSYFNNDEHFTSIFEPIYMGRTFDHVRLKAVPKSIKAARTIAMENTYRQATAKRMFTVWQSTLPEGIYLHDQRVNQLKAKAGSIGLGYATIDLHAASDDVRYSLVRSLYPNEFCEYLDLVRPRVVDYTTRHPNGTTETRSVSLTSWATMGNSLTFILESEIFYCIAKAAIAFHNRHLSVDEDGKVDLDDYANPDVFVYGDDIIVSESACETVIAFLKVCGFRVNEDKTFSSGKYRESCGAEFYDGIDLQSMYFPRFPVSNDISRAWRDSYRDQWITGYERLVQLQHRLWSVSYDAAMYLEDFLSRHDSRTCVIPVGFDACAPWGLDVRFARDINLKTYTLVEWSVLIDGYIPMDISGIVELDDVEPLEPEVEAARRRIYISVPSTKYKRVSSDLMESYLYLQYLREGPQYDSYIDELLGVSTQRSRLDTLDPDFVWNFREI